MQFFYESNIGLCMHEISKLYAVAFHFTCMGTSCISDVSAQHDFEQVVFIGWLSNKILSEYVLHSTIGGLSTVLSESVQMKYIGGLSTVLSESIQMKKIYISEGCPTFYWSLSNEPLRELKLKPFVLEIIFIHGKNAYVRESVRTRGMRFGI